MRERGGERQRKKQREGKEIERCMYIQRERQRKKQREEREKQKEERENRERPGGTKDHWSTSSLAVGREAAGKPPRRAVDR